MSLVVKRGGGIPDNFAYFQSFYVYFTHKWSYERPKIKAYPFIPFFEVTLPFMPQNR